jgi:hypothetical protein
MRFRDLLPSGTPTAASLLAAAERADEAAKVAGERLANLTEQRLAALIADDDKGLDRLENAITAAQRERDRLEEAAAELRRRHVLTVEADRVAALDALHARGLAAQRRAVELITNAYPKLAAPLVELGLELDDLEREIADVNNELRKRGDQRSVLGIDDAARPAVHPMDSFAHGFTSVLALPSPTDRISMLYPPSVPHGRMQVGRAA